jgi:L-ribulokinase
MQIYADVLNQPIEVSEATQTGALGSAIYAAVAGGVYTSVTEAADCMAAEVERVYRPDPEAVQVYGEMFGKYKELYEYFGKR